MLNPSAPGLTRPSGPQRNNTRSAALESPSTPPFYGPWACGDPRASRAYLTLTLAYGDLDPDLTPSSSAGLHLFLSLSLSSDAQVVSDIEASPRVAICFLWRGQ